MSTSEILLQMYDAMRARFGHQNWWPGDGALEVCVGAILTQNTNWTNVRKAIVNLKAAGCLSIDGLSSLSHEKLAELIRPAGYFNVKAKRLKNFILHVQSDWDDIEAFLDRPVDTLREELLTVNGIGRETADSMILYAARKATFVVDAYTARIFFRHGVISPEDEYESIKELCESHIPEDIDLWGDYHAQLVAVGKSYCKPKPRCTGCPLEPFPHDLDDEWG